ncbi:tyrosine-type recombinase/integrase [Anaerolineales bacterium HSG25]|nr:tyrosine-type recombinase/integrase [Anaerolineales bacterium HSG25]
MSIPKTVDEALHLYIDEVGKSRAPSTVRTYGYIVGKFRDTLLANDCPPEETTLTEMSNDWIHWFLDDLRHLSPTTERGYIAPILGFYEYVVAKNWLIFNLTETRYFVKRRQRKLPKRTQQLPHQQIKAVLNLLDQRITGSFEHERNKLAALRDRALFHLLADSGLRISEACSRRRGHVDWEERLIFVVGKGNKEALVRISERVATRLKRYLDARQQLDGLQGVKHLATLPLFARHDRRISNQILSISPRAVQKNLEALNKQLPSELLHEITPHTFRHYFVTTVLRRTGGDIEVAKRLARHADISTTMRYAHLSDDELDRKYDKIFNL